MTNNLSTSTMTNPQVEGLIEGYQYCFRFKAVNLGSTVGLRYNKQLNRVVQRLFLFLDYKALHVQGLWNFSPPSDPSLTMTAKTR